MTNNAHASGDTAIARKKSARYLVGIDLGTTHTVVAYADSADPDSRITLFPVEQLIAPGEVAPRKLLPSLRYHPAPDELAASAGQLPWLEPHLGSALPPGVIGTLARDLGAKVPGRLVVSAKSWLSHPAVDRTAPILPWGAPAEIGKISPLHASAAYLAHVRAAWEQQFPGYPLDTQDVILTLPASFDEAARALTVAAARLAGLERVHLVEEPQAACYDWLARHRDDLAGALGDSRLLLVCDVGGGTTDFTLIQIEPGATGPKLTRIGVGDHLMLGGDNMDLTLAHLAEQRLTASGAKLGAGALAQLLAQCRHAKESLLSATPPESARVTLLGSGSKLIGGTRSTELSRAEVQERVLEGFFPAVGPHDYPQKRRAAIVEFGLPYAADPAITRHVAAFLARHASVARAALGVAETVTPLPDAVLLNGGVFHGTQLAERLLDTLAAWRGSPLRVLHNADPDLAVARGAVAYGLARRGQGLRIGGGSARSYFLQIEDSGPARAVCLLPRGTEESTELRLPERRFALRLGQPVRFHLWSCSDDSVYRPGQVLELAGVDMQPLPPIAAVLAGGDKAREQPVELAAELTEVGTLAVSCVAAHDPQQRWQLEFQLRGDAPAQVVTGSKPHPRFDEAAAQLRTIYGGRSTAVDPKAVKRLRGDLEKILGKRDSWDTPLLRELFAVVWEHAKRRRRSADHERVWLNLAGFCLRPGFGYPLDDWRVGQLWELYPQGVQYVPDAQVWAEWWTLWRRVAGGLSGAQQEELLADVAPYIAPPGVLEKPKGTKKQGYEDMLRLAAALEHVSAARKAEVGGWLLERLQDKKESVQTWWALGRLGARAPFYGSAHQTVAPETAALWLARVLALDWKAVPPAAFAATLMARMTGDRARDVDETLRAEVAERLRAAKAPDSWINMVETVTRLDEADEQRIFGESLPPGLRLVD